MKTIKNLKYLFFPVITFAFLAISNVMAEGGSGFAKVFENAANELTGWGIALCTLMIVFGGITYMTAGSDTKGVENGKSIIKAAVVWYIIILLANMIVAFAKQLTGI
jgi:hypothetical protein